MRVACLPIMAMLAAAPLMARAEAQVYRLDPVHSQVVFNVEHNGFSRSFGRLRVVGGTIRLDRDDWSKSSVDATIDLTSVDMGDEEWDKAVRGKDLLDADRTPTAHYASDSVEKRGDDEGGPRALGREQQRHQREQQRDVSGVEAGHAVVEQDAATLEHDPRPVGCRDALDQRHRDRG